MKIGRLIAGMGGAVLMVSCAPAPAAPTPDVMVIQTSAAGTVLANFTLTAAAFTPTTQPATETPSETQDVSVPSETPTLLPGVVTATQVLCDALTVNPATVDVNIPDNTEMQPGQDFVKTWLVKNNGSCTWGAGYRVVFSYGSPPGEKLSGQPSPFNSVVAPGQEAEISVNFKAPVQAGEYWSYWQMANANGTAFPRPFWVRIIVR